jgi:RNA polymerase sigma factor (sigma-70 family)
MDPAEFPELLDAARAGEERAWSDLYHQFAGPVLGFLRGRGAAEPEDLLGEVFLQVVRNIDSFSGDLPGFRSWLFTIAYRRLIDDRRVRTRRPLELVPDPEPPPSEEDPEALDRLSEEWVVWTLRQLPSEQGDVLLLRLVAGFTIKEIAEILGKTIGAVKALQRRGLHRLEQSLREGVPL